MIPQVVVKAPGAVRGVTAKGAEPRCMSPGPSMFLQQLCLTGSAPHTSDDSRLAGQPLLLALDQVRGLESQRS